MSFSVIPTAETEYFYIQHKLTGFVLTPHDAHTDPGAMIRLFPVEPDQAGQTQLWSLTGSGLVVNKASGLVLDVSGGRIEPGTRPVIIQWRAKDSSQDRRNQQWTVTADGQLQTALDRDFVLGATGVASGANATLERKEAHPESRQRWDLVKVVVNEPTKFFIEHVRTGALLTPRQGELKEKTPLAVEPTTVSHRTAQLWSWSGDGLLGNSLSGMVADVKDAALDRGEVILWPAKSAGGENQQWSYGLDGRIHSGLGDQWVLGLNGGTEVKLVRSTGSADEQWRMRRAVFPEPVSLARAIHLNGVDQALSLAAAGPVLRDCTVEAWARTGTGGPVITSRGTTSETLGLALGIRADGALVFQVAGAQGKDGRPLVASVTTGPTAATDGEWHHLAATRTGNALTVYLDGVAVAPVDDMVPAGPLGDPPEQVLQFGTIRSGSHVTDRDWLDGDLAEVRLWNRARTAAEIPAGMHHRVDDTDPDLLGRWAFTGDSGKDSSLGGRDARVVGTPAFFDSPVELVPQGDFYLITQARLIQDWVHDPADDGTPTEIEGYRVTLTIRDGNDLPAAGFVTVALNNPTVNPQTTLHFPDGTSTTLNAATPRATLTTDVQGTVSFTMAADGQLTAPMLRAQADFMTDGSWLVIAPDRQAHATLSSITGNALRGRDENGDPIAGKTAPLPGHDPSTAEGTATAIRQMMSTAVQHNVQADRAQMHLLTNLENVVTAPYRPKHQHAALDAAGHDPATDTIGTHCIDRDAPVARLLIPENADHAHWAFDFATFTAHTPEQAAQEIANLAAIEPADHLAATLLPKFGPGHVTGGATVHIAATDYHDLVEADVLATTGGGLSWLKDHVAKAVRVIVNTVETTIVDEAEQIERKVKTLVVTAVDALETATYAVIQAVEHAVDVVAGILEKLGSDIKALVSFLKALFHWQDVVNTQRIIHTYLRNLESFTGEVMASAAGLAGTALARFRHSIDDQIEEWRGQLHDADAQSRINSAAASPPGAVQNSYISTMTSANLTKATVPGVVATTAGATIAELVADVEKEWTRIIGDAWDDVPAVFSSCPIGHITDAGTLFTRGVELILDSLQVLVDVTIDVAEKLVETLRETIAAVLRALFELLRSEIRIPVVTPFYEKVVMRDAKEDDDRKLTLLGLIALVGAMDVTFTYKLATGSTSGPFTEDEADEFCALQPHEYTWLVNPFAPHSEFAHPLGRPPMQGPRYNMILAGMVGATDAIGGLATFIVDASRILTDGAPAPAIRWLERIAQLAQVAGATAQLVATLDLFTNAPDATETDKVVSAIGTAFSGLSVVSGELAAYSETAADGPKKERWDAIITTLLGVGGLALSISFVAQRGKNRDTEVWLEFANGIIGAVENILQGVFRLILARGLSPDAALYYVTGLAAVDGLGTGGLGGTSTALVVVYSDRVQKEHPTIQ